MSEIKIGFAKTEITPPLGTELGGYAGYRPCTQVHDPLWCKTVVLEQSSGRYCFMVLDLMCVDESLYLRIAKEISAFGISKERLIVSAIHTHAAPRGGIPGEGALDRVNHGDLVHVDTFLDYMDQVVAAAGEACRQAVAELMPFAVRSARCPVPQVGSERHTGDVCQGEMTVLHIQTSNRKNLILCNFPCHPTVLSADNWQVSADFAGYIEAQLDADMTIFVNGAAGDISTRFTRRESSFEECARMGVIAAEHVRKALDGTTFASAEPITGLHGKIALRPRQVETLEAAQRYLEETTARWKQAQADGVGASTLRILKSYAEGAIVNLQFAETMAGIHMLHLPVTVFRFCGLDFASVPGELFSALQPKDLSIIGYANGYYRYIAGQAAYDAGYYETMAAIIAPGEGERLVEQIRQMRSLL